MSRSKVTDRDLGYDEFMKAMESLGDHAYVDVGFFEDGEGGKTHPRTGKTVVEYSAINEFGPEKNVAPDQNPTPPARPHHRVAYDKNEKKYEKRMKRVVNAAIEGGVKAARRELEALGDDAADLLAETIRNVDSPANAPFTIERKGFNDPLVETGQMANSTETRNSWDKG